MASAIFATRGRDSPRLVANSKAKAAPFSSNERSLRPAWLATKPKSCNLAATKSAYVDLVPPPLGVHHYKYKRPLRLNIQRRRHNPPRKRVCIKCNLGSGSLDAEHNVRRRWHAPRWIRFADRADVGRSWSGRMTEREGTQFLYGRFVAMNDATYPALAVPCGFALITVPVNAGTWLIPLGQLSER